MFDRAVQYRRNAEACEELARIATNPATERQLRDIAKQWRELAARAERD